MKRNFKYLLSCMLFATTITLVQAQNPIIRNQYTADPTARVFNNKVYLFPSHDILAKEGKGRPGWFCMEDYHVFSSVDLVNWIDHGVIVSQDKVDWVRPESYSMWAPDCIEQNGRYYFYFPSVHKDTTRGRGFSIGVAIADNPEGPYIPEEEPIEGVHGIDPNVLIDKDGQAYLYWSAGNIYVAKLKENMLELDSDVITIDNLPQKGLKEGPFVFERNGFYYLTYPHVEHKTERLEYAIGKSPEGPFEVTGVIMDESPTGCWTNHHSIVKYNHQWYLFYHHNDLSPGFDKNRSVRIDSLFFNEDGTIRKVIPTLRGVGLTKASDKIQIDRYSNISKKGASIAFNDISETFKGWKTSFSEPDAWIAYNAVDFSNHAYTEVTMRVNAPNGGLIQVRLNSPDGVLIAETEIKAADRWQVFRSPLSNSMISTNNIVVINKGKPVEIDWISFVTD